MLPGEAQHLLADEFLKKLGTQCSRTFRNSGRTRKERAHHTTGAGPRSLVQWCVTEYFVLFSLYCFGVATGAGDPNSRKPPLPPKIPKPRLSCVQRCVPVRPCESIPLLRRMAQKAVALGGRSGIAESAQHKRSNNLLPGSSRCWHTASSKGPCPLVPTVQQS